MGPTSDDDTFEVRTSSRSGGQDFADLVEAVQRGALDGDDGHLSATYVEFVEAVERGAVDGDNSLCVPSLQTQYVIALDSWAIMRADLLLQILTDAGSIRKAARVIDVPRSTLGAWFRKLKVSGSRAR